MGRLRPLKCLLGVLQSLSRMLVSGQVILFSVMRGGGAMGVRSLLVKFSGALMRIIWHGVLLPLL
jgi:hypothetical protein